MYYLAINNITDDEATYYKFSSLARVFEYIKTNDASSWTLSDRPFFDDDANGNEVYVSDYQVVE